MFPFTSVATSDPPSFATPPRLFAHKKLPFSSSFETKISGEIYGGVVYPLDESSNVPSPGSKSTVPIKEPVRSEEHTSELQSRPHLVCRLLLEKKKYDLIS